MGGNGSGKSTLLSLAAGVARPQRGRVRNRLADAQVLLPQSPKAVLACETVREELTEWSSGAGYGEAEVAFALERLGLVDAADRHPYDLSGGQQQMLALEKLLLTHPRHLLLDDLGFARAVADDVSLLFDGQITCTQPTAEFFSDSWVWRD